MAASGRAGGGRVAAAASGQLRARTRYECSCYSDCNANELGAFV